MSVKKDVLVSVDKSEEKFAATENAETVRGQRMIKLANLLLRMCALGVPLIALTIMVTAKETTTILILQITADFKTSKAFEALVGASAIVAAYSFVQTIFAVFALFNVKSDTLPNKSHAWIVFLSDQLLTYLLFGTAVAATEVSYIARNGSPRVGWTAVCDNFNKFCLTVGGAIILSHVAAAVLMISSVLSARQLFSQISQRKYSANF